MHLDTVCTMVDVDAIVMYPNVAHTLTAYAVSRRPDSDPHDCARWRSTWRPPSRS